MEANDLAQVRRRAKWVYSWLWWSPLLTLPTRTTLMQLFYGSWYVFICGEDYYYCDQLDYISWSVSILGSGLWHLVLLGIARNAHPFVRWHGRQGLLLAGVRTAIPLGFANLFPASDQAFWFVPVLLAVWFFGNRWGMAQVKRGDCWLMRKRGQGEGLPLEWLDEGAPGTTDQLLYQLLNDRLTLRRQQAAIALGRLTEREEHVEEALKFAAAQDANPHVREAARRALDALSRQARPSGAFVVPGRFDPTIRSDVLVDSQAAYERGLASLLGGQRQLAVTNLMTAFRGGDAELRQKSVEQLEKLGEIEVF